MRAPDDLANSPEADWHTDFLGMEYTISEANKGVEDHYNIRLGLIDRHTPRAEI